MTDKKILQLLDSYESKLNNIPTRVDTDRPSVWDKIQHTRGMIPKMRKYLEEGRKEKVFRWLGFLQCVFWMLDIYTVEQLANHSRPTKDDLREQHLGHSFNEECSESECCHFAGAYMEVKVPARCLYFQEFQEAPENAVSIA